MSNVSSELTTLLPSTGYLLAYALPLLIASIILTFAGAFLTLDRTRSFPPRYDTIPGAFETRKKSLRSHFLLEGGVGGIAGGYAFGIHCSTFLALLIPAVSTSAPLTYQSFVPVWLLPTLLTTILSARWKYCALAFQGISGGALLALALGVMIHPSLLARIILTAIFTPSLAILTVLPIQRSQHAALRLASCSTGAFGMIFSIALLAHVPVWGNVWDRLWVTSGVDWGSSKEKGLSAAFCAFLAIGAGTDWLLRRRFGECPDEKWDEYLANYSAHLPLRANRAGTFHPLASFWDRFLHPAHNHSGATSTETPILFPSPNDPLFKDAAFSDIPSSPIKSRSLESPFVSLPPSSPLLKPSPFKLMKGEPPRPGATQRTPSFQPTPGFLKKPRTQGRFASRAKRKRPAIKFRAGELYSSDSEDEESGEGLEAPRAFGKDGAPDYSDYEEDMGSPRSPGPQPAFLRRHQSSNSNSTTAVASSSSSIPSGAVPVPVTPSLIKAMDRIASAQKTAFGAPNVSKTEHPLAETPFEDGAPAGEALKVRDGDGQGNDVPPTRPGLPSSKSSAPGPNYGLPKFRKKGEGEVYTGSKWDEFWRDVLDKARS